MNQGDVFWYTFKAPDKRRPVVLLTRDAAISFLSSVTVAPITTTIRNIPTEVVLTENDGMPEECAANLDNLQTVAKGQLQGYITHLPPARLREIRAAIGFALGFDTLDP